MQIGMAGTAGAAGPFGLGAEALAALGLGSAAIPELQRIFNASGRSQVYQEAVRLIEEALVDYYAHNPTPKDTELTPNGVTLIQRVSASIHVVEKTLVGQLPTVQEMAQATERMTASGAVPHRAGDEPPNLINARGDIPVGVLDRDEIVSRRGNVTITRPTSAPSEVTQVTRVIPVALQGRNNALYLAFSDITEGAATTHLQRLMVELPEGASAKEVLAQKILSTAGLEPFPGKTALQSLTEHRRNANTEAAIQQLEEAYKGLGIPLPAPVPSDLAERNKKLADAFENLSDADTEKYATQNGWTNTQGEPFEYLGKKILERSALDLYAGRRSAESVAKYRLRAANDLETTQALEKAFRNLQLKGFIQN